MCHALRPSRSTQHSLHAAKLGVVRDAPSLMQQGDLCRDGHRNHAAATLLWVFIVAGATSGLRAAPSLVDSSLSVSVFASGLENPTGIRFLGEGLDFFAIEKATGQVEYGHNGSVTTVLDLNVDSDSERGLLGIALDPQFATNRNVYVYYSASSTNGDTEGSWAANRLSRFTWNGSQLANEVPLRQWATDPAQSNGPNHDGGPIAFGRDGKLYGVIGDLNRTRAEQNNLDTPSTSANSGGIYRLETNGAIPTDNPFVGQADANLRQWYAYGVRNSFGLTFDPFTGQLWDTENGPGSYDEINVVPRALNSGWTKIMGPDSRDPQGLADLVQLPGSVYSDPEFSWEQPVGVTAIEFLADSVLNKTLGDRVLIGDNNNSQIYLMQLNGARTGFNLSGGLADLVADSSTERNSLLFGSDFSVPTDIQVGPDGLIYVTSLFDNVVYRIAPNVIPLVGDANGDRNVGAADYAVWASQFGQSGVGLAGDFDRNFSVGAGDYALWAANFGAAGASSVPEPTSLALSLVAGGALLFFCGRRAMFGSAGQH